MVVELTWKISEIIQIFHCLKGCLKREAFLYRMISQVPSH